MIQEKAQDIVGMSQEKAQRNSWSHLGTNVRSNELFRTKLNKLFYTVRNGINETIWFQCWKLLKLEVGGY